MKAWISAGVRDWRSTGLGLAGGAAWLALWNTMPAECRTYFLHWRGWLPAVAFAVAGALVRGKKGAVT